VGAAKWALNQSRAPALKPERGTLRV
jgi:hypothetical protein